MSNIFGASGRSGDDNINGQARNNNFSLFRRQPQWEIHRETGFDRKTIRKCVNQYEEKRRNLLDSGVNNLILRIRVSKDTFKLLIYDMYLENLIRIDC